MGKIDGYSRKNPDKDWDGGWRHGISFSETMYWWVLILKRTKLQKPKTQCLLPWKVSNNVEFWCFFVGFPSTKWLEHILDLSDPTIFSPSLLTSVCHHLGLNISCGNLCYFRFRIWDFISNFMGSIYQYFMFQHNICLF